MGTPKWVIQTQQQSFVTATQILTGVQIAYCYIWTTWVLFEFCQYLEIIPQISDSLYQAQFAFSNVPDSIIEYELLQYCDVSNHIIQSSQGLPFNHV